MEIGNPMEIEEVELDEIDAPPTEVPEEAPEVGVEEHEEELVPAGTP